MQLLRTCKNVDKPNASLSCTYEYAKHVSKSVFGNLLPYRNWIPKEFPDIDIMSHFVMMENREGICRREVSVQWVSKTAQQVVLVPQLVPELYTLGILFSGSATFSRKGILKWDI